jgi:hypothetical protein
VRQVDFNIIAVNVLFANRLVVNEVAGNLLFANILTLNNASCCAELVA